MSTPASRPEPLKGLPRELAELDAELSGLLLEERPSFGPELRNELAREWTGQGGRPRARPRLSHALAASVAAVVAVGLAVPPARASLAGGLDRMLASLRGDDGAVVEGDRVGLPSGEAPPLDRDLGASPPPPPARSAVAAVVAEEGAPEPEAPSLPPFQPGVFAYPRLLDPAEGREAALRHYPQDLQEAGIGGVVRLHLWIKEDGSVESPRIAEQGSSGVVELDQAALRAAPALRFRPALRAGMPVSTWVEFDMVFESPSTDAPVLEPAALETPGVPEVEGWEPPESWVEAAVVPAPIRMEARGLLVLAMGDSESALEGRFGSLEGVLSGDPPPGVNPLTWRTDVVRALEEARVRDPDNAAPYLALARLRRKQGLRDEAQLLFQRGLERATRGARPVSPRLVAELAFESGRIARERWLGWRDLGDVPTRFLTGRSCAVRVGAGPRATPETLLAWNYSCPAALRDALAEGFVPRPEGLVERSTMLAAFVQAVEAYPAHVGGNTGLLLELADEEAWLEVLEGSRRFGWASQGHPNARLLEGLALQRLGRPEEAADRFRVAFGRLAAPVAEQFRGLDALYPELARGPGGEPLVVSDPILSTRVDEREVEHLARAAYAYLRFGSLETDAARVRIRYGRPARTRAFGAGPGMRLEFWDYGPGPDLTFYRPANTGDVAPTPEAEEYLRELSSFFPHGYGNGPRPVRPLTAQLTRFATSDPGGDALRVRLRMPDAFTAGEGMLELAVFVVGEGGTVREVLRRDVSRASAPELDFTIPLPRDSALAVVELSDPGSGVTAATRLSLAHALGSTSELLLLDPDRSSGGPGGRAGSGLDALSNPGWISDRVGVFVELYDLEPGSTYTLGFELEPVAAAPPLPLGFQPWDAEGFGTSFRRLAALDGPTRDRVLLDLSGIEPGAYTLRMRVETQDGRTLVRERPGFGPARGPDPGSSSDGAGGLFP